MTAIELDRATGDLRPAEEFLAVSVVIPTYNRARVLARLLDALAQCVRPERGVEFIVVDDGSSDDTARVVGASAVREVIYLRQENAGAAAARNFGWRSSRGELVAFIDDDCVPSGSWLVELVDAFCDTDSAAVGGAVVPLVPGLIADFVQAERLVGHGGDATDVKYLVTANAAFTRRALEAVGGFDERFPGAAGEDTDLTYRIQERDLQVTLINGATVAHDHRTTMKGLFRTYYRHGRAWHILAQAHPGERFGTPGSRTRRLRSSAMAKPAYWYERYRYYRGEGASAAAALVYCPLRMVGMVCFKAGMTREAADERRHPAT